MRGCTGVAGWRAASKEERGDIGVVAPAFGGVQVAGVFSGRDDGDADGGQDRIGWAGAVLRLTG